MKLLHKYEGIPSDRVQSASIEYTRKTTVAVKYESDMALDSCSVPMNEKLAWQT